MQVGILSAAPLPGGVKVARRPVKPFGVGASPTLAANFQGVMSAADGLVRNEEVAGATPATLTISGRQADISWLHLSRKQDRHRRGRSITDAFRHSFKPITKGNSMKPVVRYKSQLLFRKSYKPDRSVRIRPVAKPSVTFRPMRRFGVKPQLELVS